MTKAEFIVSIRAACNAYESDSPGPVIPPPVIVPPGTGGVFDIFNRLQAKAPEYVAWRYVMQTPSGPLQAALIAQMGANGYANKLAWTGGQPQAPIYEGAIYWLDPNWTGPPPFNILQPGYLHESIEP